MSQHRISTNREASTLNYKFDDLTDCVHVTLLMLLQFILPRQSVRCICTNLQIWGFGTWVYVFAHVVFAFSGQRTRAAFITGNKQQPGYLDRAIESSVGGHSIILLQFLTKLN